MLKKIFSVEGARNFDGVILAVRVAISLMMLAHGLPKLEKLFASEPVQFMSVLGLAPELLLGLVVFAEVGCSLFLLFGFGTRIATIPLIITMLVAVFYVHIDDPFVKMEMGLHYLMAYFILLVVGSGKYSADYLLQQYYIRKEK